MCDDFTNGNLCTVTYEAVRKAMDGHPFTMSITGDDEIRAVLQAVNEGIGAHLEVCFCPDRGDRYEGGKRRAGKLVLCNSLDCVVSRESLPVLLRRICESEFGGDTDLQSAAMSLADDILTVLGFNAYGKFVGREALGLA